MLKQLFFAFTSNSLDDFFDVRQCYCYLLNDTVARQSNAIWADRTAGEVCCNQMQRFDLWIEFHVSHFLRLVKMIQIVLTARVLATPTKKLNIINHLEYDMIQL